MQPAYTQKIDSKASRTSFSLLLRHERLWNSYEHKWNSKRAAKRLHPSPSLRNSVWLLQTIIHLQTQDTLQRVLQLKPSIHTDGRNRMCHATKAIMKDTVDRACVLRLGFPVTALSLSSKASQVSYEVPLVHDRLVWNP